jgi:hypothetical protein
LAPVKKIKIVGKNYADQIRSVEEYFRIFIDGTDVCIVSNENVCVSEEYTTE